MSTNPEEIPPELVKLWQNERPLTFAVRPRDAWTIVGIVQFASRNPALSSAQRTLITTFGRRLQEAIAAVEPRLAPILEAGWDPAHDVPRRDDDSDPGLRVAPL